VSTPAIPSLHREVIETKDGPFVAWFTKHGLAELDFPNRPSGTVSSGEAPARLSEWLRLTRHALNAMLAGQPPAALPPFDLSAGTDFQQKIWRALLTIPAGQTMTYAEIAAAIKHPSAIRAAGGACGANPIPVLIPCHRVVAAHKKLGGFSGGLDWKRKLLQRENTLPMELL
jgi:O-6-methylguanine DNA methyltransferase